MVEAQATDRAFRTGQQKKCNGTPHDIKRNPGRKNCRYAASKKQLANLAVANGEKWLGKLSDKEIKELVSLGE